MNLTPEEKRTVELVERGIYQWLWGWRWWFVLVIVFVVLNTCMPHKEESRDLRKIIHLTESELRQIIHEEVSK